MLIQYFLVKKQSGSNKLAIHCTNRRGREGSCTSASPSNNAVVQISLMLQSQNASVETIYWPFFHKMKHLTWLKLFYNGRKQPSLSLSQAYMVWVILEHLVLFCGTWVVGSIQGLLTWNVCENKEQSHEKFKTLVSLMCDVSNTYKSYSSSWSHFFHKWGSVELPIN